MPVTVINCDFVLTLRKNIEELNDKDQCYSCCIYHHSFCIPYTCTHNTRPYPCTQSRKQGKWGGWVLPPCGPPWDCELFNSQCEYTLPNLCYTCMSLSTIIVNYNDITKGARAWSRVAPSFIMLNYKNPLLSYYSISLLCPQHRDVLAGTTVRPNLCLPSFFFFWLC